MKSLVRALIWLPLVVFVASVQAQTIEWKLKKGQSFDVQTVNEMVTSMILPDGAKQELPMKQMIDVQWNVGASDDKSFAIEQTVKRVRTSMKSPIINVEYDSDQGDPTDPVGKQFALGIKPVLGVPISLKMGRLGNLIELKLPPSLVEQKSNPANPLSAESLKSSFQQQIEFPKLNFSVGDTWEQTLKANVNGMQTQSVLKFRFDGNTDRDGRKFSKFHVDAVTELVQSPPGVEVTLKDTGSDGEIFFDAELGCVFESIQRQNLDMNLNVAGQKVNQSIQGTTTTTFRLAN
ncbi:MAG: hypothetical protein NTV29_06110 [Planctomycetota bacterium]|nr:hypothetical protein [Planctomycetota bacterium]